MPLGEATEILGAKPERAERLLVFLHDEGRLVRLNKNVILSRSHMQQARDIVVTLIEQHGLLDSADFKQHIGSTRKYALAILDYLDGRRITIRQGNNRKLAANHQERPL